MALLLGSIGPLYLSHPVSQLRFNAAAESDRGRCIGKFSDLPHDLPPGLVYDDYLRAMVGNASEAHLFDFSDIDVSYCTYSSPKLLMACVLSELMTSLLYVYAYCRPVRRFGVARWARQSSDGHQVAAL